MVPECTAYSEGKNTKTRTQTHGASAHFDFNPWSPVKENGKNLIFPLGEFRFGIFLRFVEEIPKQRTKMLQKTEKTPSLSVVDALFQGFQGVSLVGLMRVILVPSIANPLIVAGRKPADSRDSKVYLCWV